MSERPVAVITGGARGIGYQIAADLLGRGYRVVIGDLDEEATRASAARLGGAATGVRLDITDRPLVAEVIETVEREIGPIDVWVNNAGIMPTGAFATQSIELVRTVADVDYAALVEVTAAILPRLLARRRGTLVNIASATGLKPLAGLAVYSGTKAAVIGFSDALRRELRGTGVHVKVIMPNLATTAMGAGITPPKLTPAVTAAQVSRAVLRAIDGGTFATTVPRSLGGVLRFSRLLPTAVQDWIDDRVGTDRIGLGGDPAARAAYAAALHLEPESQPEG
ncbi:SDR family NAD(P)-dependent oxidoreductase [Herbiconiux sp. 11R-BC]|uniref:SDR family NAD(P)-dependent oxidoreductase n=1 Tax=Herbiconiux sp. 11R-BC TaxID=3111637 RepID=UPI003BFF4421